MQAERPQAPQPLPTAAPTDRTVRIGCAGWSIPKASAADLPASQDSRDSHVSQDSNAGVSEGAKDSGPDKPSPAPSPSHLQRYAQRLPAVEINSSFYRAHRPATYRRWEQSVPASFRFAVKVPRRITHERRLIKPEEPLAAFLSEASLLGPKLGPLLVQLPPSLPFDADTARAFFTLLRERFAGQVACEPRHPSWFVDSPDEATMDGATAEQVLTDFQVARVAADPAIVREAARPGGWSGLVYYRLHGSPRLYYSDYAERGPGYLESLTATLAASVAAGTPTWCIFDNTAQGAATANALTVLRQIERQIETDV